MRKLQLFCGSALVCYTVLVLAGCAPTGVPDLRARDERNFPDPALGVKNSESETYSTQQLASPAASPSASEQSAPVAQAPVPPPGK